jgi:hypothetical protein
MFERRTTFGVSIEKTVPTLGPEGPSPPPPPPPSAGGVVPELEAEPEPELELEPELDPDPELEPELELDAEPELEPAPEPPLLPQPPEALESSPHPETKSPAAIARAATHTNFALLAAIYFTSCCR